MIGTYANGPTFITLESGSLLDISNPDPYGFTLPDMINGMSRVFRYGAQTPYMISVAEHSLNCYQTAFHLRVPSEAYLAILLHDAAEAFVGDMIRPIKYLLPEFATRVELPVQRAIGVRFGVDFDRHAEYIKRVDTAVLFAEKRVIYPDADAWEGESDYPIVHLDIPPTIHPKLNLDAELFRVLVCEMGSRYATV